MNFDLLIIIVVIFIVGMWIAIQYGASKAEKKHAERESQDAKADVIAGAGTPVDRPFGGMHGKK